jgi:hypothetical protein
LAVWIARRCASLHSRRDTARLCRANRVPSRSGEDFVPNRSSTRRSERRAHGATVRVPGLSRPVAAARAAPARAGPA